MYGHLFDSKLSEEKIDFESLIVEVNEENKNVVIPMLLKLAVLEEQKSKLHEVCQRVMFDITAIESGVCPETTSQTKN